MKRMIKASRSDEMRFVLEYGAPFALRSKMFRTEAELYKFIRSHVFANPENIRAYERKPIGVNPTVVSPHDANTKEVERKLFDRGIVDYSDWAVDQESGGEKIWAHTLTQRMDNYTYGSHYVIQSSDEGWVVLTTYGDKVAGPFRSWIEAENYVDMLDAEEGY